MFTGIVRDLGTLIEKKHVGKNATLTIKSKLKPKLGDSISVNGVCLTVTKKIGSNFTVDVIPETLRRTTLGGLAKNAQLNLESSMKLGGSLDGHFVMGHVDAVSKVSEVKKQKHGAHEIMLELPPSLRGFVAEKGSLTVNGVSLTVAHMKGSRATVAIIPFTSKTTNLGMIKKDDYVNIEVDIIARYLKKLSETFHV